MYPDLSLFLREAFGLALPFPLHTYGLAVGLGACLAVGMTARLLDAQYAVGRIGLIRIPVRGRWGRAAGTHRPALPGVVMGPVLLLGSVAGVAGGKLFYVLHDPAVWRAPLAFLFSGSGLAFYGGFACGLAACLFYVRQRGLPVRAFLDAFAPGFMLFYSLARLGCHLAGDGDWGLMADLAARPGWVPLWLWAETYPNNVLGAVLPAPGVYPTALWEAAVCLPLASVLLLLRRHPFRAGWLFSLYLVLAGLGRLLVEPLRAGARFDLFGWPTTSVTVLALTLLLAGLVGLIYTSRRATASGHPTTRLLETNNASVIRLA